MSNYAPEYTKRERVVFVIKQLLWFLPLFLVTKLWLVDWLSGYADEANCYHHGNITGVHIIMYGLFVGIPLFVAILLTTLEGRRALKVIKLGQSPLPEEKVFTKTKYKYGYKTKIKPIILLCIIGLIIMFSLWGSIHAHALTQNIAPCDQQITSQSNSNENSRVRTQ